MSIEYTEYTIYIFTIEISMLLKIYGKTLGPCERNNNCRCKVLEHEIFFEKQSNFES